MCSCNIHLISLYHDQAVEENHVIDWDEAKVLDREAQRQTRWIKGHFGSGNTDMHASGCRILPTHGTRWFPGHMLHRAVNRQDVIKIRGARISIFWIRILSVTNYPYPYPYIFTNRYPYPIGIRYDSFSCIQSTGMIKANWMWNDSHWWPGTRRSRQPGTNVCWPITCVGRR